MLELTEFQPKIVDRKHFIRCYNGTKIELIVEGMGQVSEAYRDLNFLEMDSQNKTLQERIWVEMCGMQQNLPLGKNADLQLQGLKADLQGNSNYQDMQRYKEVLDDLMQGYRKILKERHNEL